MVVDSTLQKRMQIAHTPIMVHTEDLKLEQKRQMPEPINLEVTGLWSWAPRNHCHDYQTCLYSPDQEALRKIATLNMRPQLRPSLVDGMRAACQSARSDYCNSRVRGTERREGDCGTCRWATPGRERKPPWKTWLKSTEDSASIDRIKVEANG